MAELYNASKQGYLHLVKEYLKQGQDVNYIDEKDGATALYAAVQDEHFDVANVLLEAGADPNIPESSGWMPLHVAMFYDNATMVTSLLEKGADINAQTYNTGETPLIMAVDLGVQENVEILLQHGADISIRKNDGKNALDVAHDNNDNWMINILESYQHFNFSSITEGIQPSQTMMKDQITRQIGSHDNDGVSTASTQQIIMGAVVAVSVVVILAVAVIIIYRRYKSSKKKLKDNRCNKEISPKSSHESLYNEIDDTYHHLNKNETETIMTAEQKGTSQPEDEGLNKKGEGYIYTPLKTNENDYLEPVPSPPPRKGIHVAAEDHEYLQPIPSPPSGSEDKGLELSLPIPQNGVYPAVEDHEYLQPIPSPPPSVEDTYLTTLPTGNVQVDNTTEETGDIMKDSDGNVSIHKPADSDIHLQEETYNDTLVSLKE